jgi:hypothetical protein
MAASAITFYLVAAATLTSAVSRNAVISSLATCLGILAMHFLPRYLPDRAAGWHYSAVLMADEYFLPLVGLVLAAALGAVFVGPTYLRSWAAATTAVLTPWTLISACTFIAHLWRNDVFVIVREQMSPYISASLFLVGPRFGGPAAGSYVVVLCYFLSGVGLIVLAINRCSNVYRDER